VNLNFRTKVATLVRSDNQPESESASAEGNAQTTPDGDLFAGWGTLPYISEFSPSGEPALERRVPGRGEHLPRLPAAVAHAPAVAHRS
jgi:hypothetical protein